MSALDRRRRRCQNGTSAAARRSRCASAATPSIALAKPLPTFSAEERRDPASCLSQGPGPGDARKLQLALALMTLLGLLVVRLRPGVPPARSPSRWHGSTKPPAGSHRASMSRSTCAASDELARLATSFNEMAGKIAEREQRITQLAFNDVLTGLPNRTMFQQQLDHCFARRNATAACSRFTASTSTSSRSINDTLGHPAGDTLLIEAGATPAAAAEGHFVARLGGDEFVVLQRVGE